MSTERERTERFAAGMAHAEEMETTDEYAAFVDKFKIKKTTDECYTPDNVYDVVLSWATERYKLDGREIIRPFYPGGDYENEEYPDNCVVVDNPPFSIVSKICDFYNKRGIAFFLFAPHLTLFSTGAGKYNYIVVDAKITYQNGAIVSTGFVTNLPGKKIIVPLDLRWRMKEADAANRAKEAKSDNRYTYPRELASSALLGHLATAGAALEIAEEDTYFVRGLDSQKPYKKSIYGAGFLLSEKAAAEKAAAEKAAAEKLAAEKAAARKWELSEREREIIRGLGGKSKMC